MRLAGHMYHAMVEMRNEYEMLVRKPEGKRPIGIPMYRWGGVGDNIKMNLKHRV
jgi:hypothetical protein